MLVADFLLERCQEALDRASCDYEIDRTGQYPRDIRELLAEHDVLALVQKLVDLGGHSHMFCFFPEKGSLMDHLPATPRDQWRRVQLARYLIDYRGVRV